MSAAQPVESPSRPVLFVNPRSGGGKAERVGLVPSAAILGIEVVILSPTDDLTGLATDAAAGGRGALGIAGGDGSVGTVAAIASSHDVPLVCVPTGTRNHFALDIGLDVHDPLSALRAFTDPVERRIDVGAVNGRVFVNNVSLGVYGQAVARDTYRDAKLRTLIETADEVLGPTAESAGVRVVDDTGAASDDPAVVVVSNNAYRLHPNVRKGARGALDGRSLGVIVIDAPRVGRPPTGRSWTTPSLDIAAATTLAAGIDGEPADLAPPLRFEIRAEALRLLLPAPRGRVREGP